MQFPSSRCLLFACCLGIAALVIALFPGKSGAQDAVSQDQEGEMRTWKTAEGTHEIEAAFVSSDGVKVTLRRADNGQLLEVYLISLSPEDADYARALAQLATGSELEISGMRSHATGESITETDTRIGAGPSDPYNERPNFRKKVRSIVFKGMTYENIVNIVMPGIILGVIIYLVGGLVLVVQAFCESVVWGLCVFFLPLGGLVFVIVCWKRAWSGFAIVMFGWFIIGSCLFLLPNVLDDFR